MKLKNPMITSNNILSLYPIHEAVSLLGEVGYDGIEMWASQLRQQLDEKTTTIDQINKALKEHNLTGVVHAPLTDYKNPLTKLNITSKNKELRERSLDLNLQSLEWTKQLGFEIMVLHPGHTDKAGEVADGEYWNFQIAAFKKLTKKAEELGIRIGLEPMEDRPKEFVIYPVEVNRLLDAIGSKSLGLTFDLIHAYTCSEDAPIEFLEPFHKNIIHVHVSGHSKKKNHVPFSMSLISHIFLDKALEALVGKYHSMISIEGSLKGIEELTKERQKQVVIGNLEYIRKDLKSLHLV